MAEICIVRAHVLGLARARKLAGRWAEEAGRKLDVVCSYEQGDSHDVVRFERPGARGELRVGEGSFELHARLGLLLRVFQAKIESEIVRNLDELLAHEDPLHAFEQGLAQHEARRAARRATALGEAHRHPPRPAARRK